MGAVETKGSQAYQKADEEPHTFVSRAERLRFKRTLNHGRISRLKVFRTRITDWNTPDPFIFEEPIIVEVKVKRKRMVQRAELVEPEEVTWYDSLSIDHFHPKVVQFEDLLDQKTRIGYKVDVKDAILAYMLVFEWGRKTVISGFLSTFPEFKDFPRLREMVGENLSRLHAEGFIDTVPMDAKKLPPPPYYIPRPPEEALYMAHPTRRQIQLKRARWWEKGW